MNQLMNIIIIEKFVFKPDMWYIWIIFGGTIDCSEAFHQQIINMNNGNVWVSDGLDDVVFSGDNITIMWQYKYVLQLI